MAVSIVDGTAAAAWLAATTQRAQLEALAAPWGGSAVTARFFSAGGDLLRTQTLPALSIDTVAAPYRFNLGRYVADTHVAEGTAARLDLRAGSTDIVRLDCGLTGSGASVELAGPLKELCPPDLAGVELLADSALPAGPPNTLLLTDDGMMANGTLPLGSLELDGAVFVGHNSQDGPRVAKHVLATGVTTVSDSLRTAIGNSDHSAPCVVARSDGRLTAFYSRHNIENTAYQRTTVNPGDVSSWGTEVNLNDGGAITYPSVIVCGSRWLLTFRVDNSWRYRVSTDEGATWGPGITAATYSGDGSGSRPYLLPVWNAAQSRVDFAVIAQGADRFLVPYLWHVYATFDGSNALTFFKTDGTSLGAAFDAANATEIYNGAPDGVDIAFQIVTINPSTGAVWIMARRINSTTSSDMLLYRQNGTGWLGPSTIYNAGYPTSPTRTDYVPGAVFHPTDPTRVFGIRSTGYSGPSRLAEYATTDGGATWAFVREMTPWSEDNVELLRPHAIQNGTKYLVAWASGRFTELTDWDTSILMGA